MKRNLFFFLIILSSLLFFSCGNSLADLLNKEFDFTPPIYVTYKTDYGKTPSRVPVKRGDTITEEMLPSVKYTNNSSYYYYYYDDDYELSFDGWYYDEEYSKKVEAGDIIEGSITLYAKWKNAFVDVSFHINYGYLKEYMYNNGYFEGSRAYNTYINRYKIGTVLSGSNLPEPYYDYYNDYIFLGWYLDPDYNTPAEGYVIESDTNLYAKECYNGDCTIWYYSPLASYSDLPERKTIQAGEKLSSYYLPVLTPYSEYENYVFMGWYYDYDCTRKAQEGDEVKSEITLYAKWEHKYVYIDYYSNYSVAELPERKKVENGSTLLSEHIPEITPPSEYEDYRFAGWYYDFEFINEAHTGDVIDRDITLYLKWETLHITINYNTFGYAQPVYEVKVVDNGSILTTDLLPELVPYSGYDNLIFVGWYYDSNYERPAYVGDVLSGDNIWLYAKYDAIANGTFLQYWVYDETVSDDYELWDSLTTVYNPTFYNVPEEIQFKYYYAGEEGVSYETYTFDGVEYTNGSFIKRYYVKREMSSNNLERLLALYRAYDCTLDLTITDSNPDLDHMAYVLKNNNIMRCHINIWLGDCTQLTSIPENCFKDVLYMDSIRLPDSIQTIGKNAFKGCSDLESIHMYPSVTLIEEAAFEDCPLYSVYFRGNEEDRANMTINDLTILNAYWYYNWY